MSDLSKTLDRSVSELYRMVDCLEKRGYIIKDELSGNFMLSLKLYELAHTHSPMEQLLKAAYKPMYELAMAVRESCHLSVLRHGELFVISQADSPEKLRLSVEVGSHHSVLNTVSGRLLLAHLSKEELDFILDQNKEYQAWDNNKRLAFTKRLNEIRMQGYSYAEDESLRGINDISVLVGNPKTGPVAALAIPYLTTTENKGYREELLNALKNCIEQIHRALGVMI